VLDLTVMEKNLSLLSRRGRHSLAPGPWIMGIVNVNDDSFSGDGTLDFTAAVEQARRQAEAGADIIDVGAESARTNRAAISVEEEIRRLRGFLEKYDHAVSQWQPRDERQLWPPLLSINTWRPAVAAAILPQAGEILNDMSGLPDPTMAQLCAQYGVALLIMHTVGEPKVPHTDQQWPDLMKALDDFFTEKIALALAHGVPRESIIIDPGIDFAKQKDDNLLLLRDGHQLTRHGVPVLWPISRKSVIGRVLVEPQAAQRDAGTMALLIAAQQRGGHIFRAHAVEPMVSAVRLLQAISGVDA
jgi:dihydropteroate synthase